MKANPERCSHPVKRLATFPAFGHLWCTRCDTDLTDRARSFEHRHSERVTLRQGDRVSVSGGGPHGASFQGTFQWVERGPSGIAYCVAEKQTFKQDGKTFEGTAALRTVRPEYVRQAPGVRQRKAREEA